MMNIPSIYSFSDYIFAIKENPLTFLSARDKKIALVALAVFCAFTVGYYVMSCFFQAKKIQIDDQGGDLDTIHEIQDSHDDVSTPYQAKMSLASGTGMLAGIQVNEFREEYDFYEWKFPDGKDLPVKEDTLLLRFMLFDATEELESLVPGASSSHSIYLPDFLFVGKKEGDAIILKHKGELVRFVLKENASYYLTEKGSSKKEPLKFEEAFENAVNDSLRKIKNGTEGSLYSRPPSRTEGYTLDFGGLLYHSKRRDPEDETQGREIIRGDARDFQRLNKPQIVERIFMYDENNIRFKIEMLGIRKQVDIVVNDKYLCFFAKEEIRLDLDPESPPFLKCEYLCTILWRHYFKNLSLEEMQERIENAQTEFDHDYFTITIET